MPNLNVRSFGTTLLSAVTATGASAEFAFGEFSAATFYITAASVTSGGTMVIQAKAPTGVWYIIDSHTISSSGDLIVECDGAFEALRANLTARTDGTYTVSVFGRP